MNCVCKGPVKLSRRLSRLLKGQTNRITEPPGVNCDGSREKQPIAETFISFDLDTGGPSSSCEMIILRSNSHGGIIRVCMGIFMTALRNKKIRQILKKKYLTLLPQRIACYLTAYFDEKSPFERVVHFEVFNVHKKSPDNMFISSWPFPRSTNPTSLCLPPTVDISRFSYNRGHQLNYEL